MRFSRKKKNIYLDLLLNKCEFPVPSFYLNIEICDY